MKSESLVPKEASEPDMDRAINRFRQAIIAYHGESHRDFEDAQSRALEMGKAEGALWEIFDSLVAASPVSGETVAELKEALDERVSAIRQRCEAATPGPWVCEVEIREREETAHYQIRTVEPQPSHPWSPRFLAWMMGGRSIAPNVFKSLSPWDRSNLVDKGLRDDRKVEPDAQFIAHAREDVPWLLAQLERLKADSLTEIEADWALTGWLAHRNGSRQPCLCVQCEDLRAKLRRLSQSSESPK